MDIIFSGSFYMKSLIERHLVVFQGGYYYLVTEGNCWLFKLNISSDELSREAQHEFFAGVHAKIMDEELGWY